MLKSGGVGRAQGMKFLSSWGREDSASQQGMVQWEHHEPLGFLLQLETGKGFPHHVSNPVLTHPYLPPESLKIVSITCPSLSQGWAAELLLFFAAAKSYHQELTSSWRFGQCPVSEQWHRREALACVTSSPRSCPRVCCPSEPWLMTEGQQRYSEGICTVDPAGLLLFSLKESPLPHPSLPSWDDAAQRGQTGTCPPTFSSAGEWQET